MPAIIHDRLHIDGRVYTIDREPIAPWLACLPGGLSRGRRHSVRMAMWPCGPLPMTPCYWRRSLTKRSRACSRIFLRPVPAVWFSGFIHGWRSDRRNTGYPPRRFHDDEVVLGTVSGTVTRIWRLDLRAVPDQTDGELRLSLPAFLWPARLRGT